MDLLKISNYIDNFFEQKNGELKFSRKLVNKDYAKKIGFALFIIITIVLNLMFEAISNIGFNKSPNLLLGLFHFRFKCILVYLVMYLIVGLIYIRMIFSIRASFKEIDEGQKGTSRFATRKEIDKQYRAIPIARYSYKGSGGVPIARGFKEFTLENGEKKLKEVMYIDDSSVNNLIIGTTRSGKGETFVIPLIDIYSRAEKKSALIVNDPKGEIIAMCKETLEERGYDVLMLNLLQPINSMSYNPLELVKQAYKKGDYSEAQLLCKTLTHSLYYKPNVKDPFWQNSAMSLVNALILAICDECIKRGEEEKITLYTVSNMLSELGGKNTPSDDGKKEINALDEYFKTLPADSVAKSQYATSSFAGGSARGNIFSVAMSELQTYTLEETGKLTSKNSLNFEDIGFHKTFKLKVTVKDKLDKIDLENNKAKTMDINKLNGLKNKVLGIRDIVIEKVIETKEGNSSFKHKTNEKEYKEQLSLEDEIEQLDIKQKSNSSNTDSNLKSEKAINKEKRRLQKENLKKEILNGVRAFNVDGKEVTSDITVDVSEVNFNENGEYEVYIKVPLERPKAVFMVTPDYDKSNHILASIFVRQIYYVLAKKASLNDTSKCDREVIFTLDEFGNMPSIEGFANIITVCLGRGIRFNMIIQAYSQLKNLYGEDAPTIEGNCGNQIYIMTNEGETAKKFSELLGDKTIITNSRSGEVFSLNKSQTESLDARKLLKSDELMKLKEGETVVVRVIKRQDNERNKIVSYPIYNNDEHSMKYRYEYLYDYFDNQESVFKNIKVKSLHKDINLKDLIIDFSKTAEQIKIDKVNEFDKITRDLTVKKRNKNLDKSIEKQLEGTIDTSLIDGETNSIEDLKPVKQDKPKLDDNKIQNFIANISLMLSSEEINEIDAMNNKEDILEYLGSIEKDEYSKRKLIDLAYTFLG